MKVLKEILHNEVNREKLISEFQEEVWNGNAYGMSGECYEIIQDLAHDLDYYRSDNDRRKSDPSYYGNERLKKEIVEANKKLKELNCL